MLESSYVMVSDHGRERYRQRVGYATYDQIVRHVKESTPVGAKTAKRIRRHIWSPKTQARMRRDNGDYFILRDRGDVAFVLKVAGKGKYVLVTCFRVGVSN